MTPPSTPGGGTPLLAWRCRSSRAHGAASPIPPPSKSHPAPPP
eukprot:CAMPEP_0172041780 /NCGR_PEP_ID=MMETSP1041-20130122/25285_1 /TAXON_ID=464988 /ORGANISM="Hemiselmis andersenii, Strain CCMP439" /LENGTH=42 /DNA_ID= /DNA_START= /DNA_END= /DNA_ORIENTATION=